MVDTTVPPDTVAIAQALEAVTQFCADWRGARTFSNSSQLLDTFFELLAEKLGVVSTELQHLRRMEPANQVAAIDGVTGVRGAVQGIRDEQGIRDDITALTNALRTGTQTRVNRVEVHWENSDAIVTNSHIVATKSDEPLTPLTSIITGDPVPNFPAHIYDISSLDSDQVNRVLEHLGRPTTHSLVIRRARLKRAIGGLFLSSGIKV